MAPALTVCVIARNHRINLQNSELSRTRIVFDVCSLCVFLFILVAYLLFKNNTLFYYVFVATYILKDVFIKNIFPFIDFVKIIIFFIFFQLHVVFSMEQSRQKELSVLTLRFLLFVLSFVI